jgi:hypothetical protein
MMRQKVWLICSCGMEDNKVKKVGNYSGIDFYKQTCLLVGYATCLQNATILNNQNVKKAKNSKCFTLHNSTIFLQSCNK